MFKPLLPLGINHQNNTMDATFPKNPSPESEVSVSIPPQYSATSGFSGAVEEWDYKDSTTFYGPEYWFIAESANSDTASADIFINGERFVMTKQNSKTYIYKLLGLKDLDDAKIWARFIYTDGTVKNTMLKTYNLKTASDLHIDGIPYDDKKTTFVVKENTAITVTEFDPGVAAITFSKDGINETITRDVLPYTASEDLAVFRLSNIVAVTYTLTNGGYDLKPRLTSVPVTERKSALMPPFKVIKGMGLSFGKTAILDDGMMLSFSELDSFPTVKLFYADTGEEIALTGTSDVKSTALLGTSATDKNRFKIQTTRQGIDIESFFTIDFYPPSRITTMYLGGVVYNDGDVFEASTSSVNGIGWTEENGDIGLLHNVEDSTNTASGTIGTGRRINFSLWNGTSVGVTTTHYIYSYKVVTQARVILDIKKVLVKRI